MGGTEEFEENKYLTGKTSPEVGGMCVGLSGGVGGHEVGLRELVWD